MGWFSFGMTSNDGRRGAAVEMPEERTGERMPLAATGTGESEDWNVRSNQSNFTLWRLLGTAFAIVLVAFLIVDHFVETKRKIEEATVVETPQSSTDTTSPQTLRYRSLCNTYGKHQVKIIQTSLGQPSQQWMPVPCFPIPPEKVGLFKTKPVEQQIDRSFEYPDAVLQINFEEVGHRNRSVPILGFGGAFTEAAALNYRTLSQKGKDTVMELLYGKAGLGYSLGRVPINSCDFSVKSYSFDDTDGDFDLNDFDMGVTHDVATGMVDMMLRATSVLREGWGRDGDVDETDDGNLKIFASPWSPPAWMKAPTPDDKEGAEHAAKMTNSKQPTCLREGVGPDSRYAKAWARYFSKFLTAYENLGVPLFAVSIQNEPEFPAPWEACSYTPRTESEFLANHLGPELRASHPNVKIFIFDHNKDHAPKWVTNLLNSNAAEYVDGTAVHWYAGGMDRLLDGALGNVNMHRVMSDLKNFSVYEDHILFGSEACHCPYTGYAGGDIGVAWARAERYAHTILADLAAGSNGWVEWNLILDSRGGPNHLGNLCDTSLLAVPHRALDAGGISDTFPFEHTTHKFGRVVGDGRTREELNSLGYPAKYLDAGVAVQPMYFYMGHISRYVRPGSRAVKSLVDTSEFGRAYRPKGYSVSGGGINDLARENIEVLVWPCEGSTRQKFRWNEQKQLQVMGHDWLGKPTTSCIRKTVDRNFHGVVLGSCNETLNKAGIFELLPYSVSETTDFVNFRLTNSIRKTAETCLMVEPLKNEGGAYGLRGGSQVTLGRCDLDAARWTFKPDTGEISSSYFVDGVVCMTTGWPFLQMGAFSTPNGETDKAVVVLNEAGDAANYILRDRNEIILTGSIPPHSIQTILLD